jgi:plasmid maintenance system antidote protein VapI
MALPRRLACRARGLSGWPWEETPVTPDTALPAFWINLPGQYDLERATDAVSREIARIKPVQAA